MGKFPRHEVLRKFIHLSTSLLPLSLLVLDPEVWTGLIAALLILAIAVDIARLRVQAVHRFFKSLFGDALRPHEANELTGSTFMCLSALLCIVLFPVPIAVTALLFLTIGDSAAALIGQRWGRTSLRPGKTIEGTLACLGSCIIIVIVMPGIHLLVGFTGALTATTVELFGTETIDDNFGIPVLSALAMWIVASVVV